MSELTPYTHTDAVDSWVEVIRPVTILAQQIADTDFVPRALRGNAPAVAAVILHGRELGMGPMTALSQTHVIDGKPAISAEGQRALVVGAGHEIEFTELSDAVATCRGRRAGSDRWLAVTWTLDRARAAGLLGRSSGWKNYPRAMLAARASAELCRLVFADVLHGTAATEELEQPEDDEKPAVKGRTRAVGRTAPPTPPPIPEAPPTAQEWPELPAVPLPEDAEKTEQLPPQRATPAQLKMLGAVWSRFGVTDDQRRTLSGLIAGRDLEGSTRNLRKLEASLILEKLTGILNDVGEGADPGAVRLAFDVMMGDHYLGGEDGEG